MSKSIIKEPLPAPNQELCRSQITQGMRLQLRMRHWALMHPHRTAYYCQDAKMPAALCSG